MPSACPSYWADLDIRSDSEPPPRGKNPAEASTLLFKSSIQSIQVTLPGSSTVLLAAQLAGLET